METEKPVKTGASSLVETEVLSMAILTDWREETQTNGIKAGREGEMGVALEV